MTPYTSYLPFVAVSVPECPEEIILDAIGGSIIRLCEEGLVWKVMLPAIDIVQGDDTYPITPTDTGYEDTRVVIPTFVEYNSVPLIAATTEDLDVGDEGWRDQDEATPVYYVVEEIGYVRLSRKPDQSITDGLKVRVAIKPTQAATTAADLIFEDYRETIENGALSVLHGMSRKPWYDAKEAANAAKLFTYQIQRAKARTEMGATNRPTTVKMRSWI